MAGSAKNFTPGTAPRQPRYRFELLIAPGMRSNFSASILGWVLAVNGVHATGNDGRDDDDPTRGRARTARRRRGRAGWPLPTRKGTKRRRERRSLEPVAARTVRAFGRSV